MVLPSAAGLPANRSCHKRLLMTTAGMPPGRSSSGDRSRPSASFTPRVPKKFEETSFAVDVLRRAGTRQIKALSLKRRDLIEGAGIPLPVEEVRIRKIRGVPKSSIVERHQNQAIRLVVRQRREHNAFATR